MTTSRELFDRALERWQTLGEPESDPGIDALLAFAQTGAAVEQAEATRRANELMAAGPGEWEPMLTDDAQVTIAVSSWSVLVDGKHLGSVTKGTGGYAGLVSCVMMEYRETFDEAMADVIRYLNTEA